MNLFVLIQDDSAHLDVLVVSVISARFAKRAVCESLAGSVRVDARREVRLRMCARLVLTRQLFRGLQRSPSPTE